MGVAYLEQKGSCPDGHTFKKKEVIYNLGRTSFKCPVCGNCWAIDNVGRWLKNGLLWRKGEA